MKHVATTGLALFFFAIFIILFNTTSTVDYFAKVNVKTLLGLAFPQTQTPQDIQSKYTSGKVRILIVSGHDNQYSGTEFKKIPEAALTLKVAETMYELFKGNSHFEVFTTRNFTDGEYNDEFKNYFVNDRDNILAFMNEKHTVMEYYLQSGEVTRHLAIEHVKAASEVQLRLYGINKWSNEHDMDIVIHLHFNDYPGRGFDRAGKYSGFSIYVPDNQYPNAVVSKEVADQLYKQLAGYLSVSNFPKEKDVIIEDQELIAPGANASRNKASLLIEYGYVYEPQFVNQNIQTLFLPELALQTYFGIVKYFDPNIISNQTYNTLLLPHDFTTSLKKGLKSDPDVLALQAALVHEGLYPPTGQTLEDCPMTGNFGPCVEKSVIAFQEKYRKDILKSTLPSAATGFVGTQTLLKLNKLYSQGID